MRGQEEMCFLCIYKSFVKGPSANCQLCLCSRWGALRGVGNDLVGPRLSREVSGETQTVAQSNERERLVLAKPTFVASLCALEAGAVFHVRSRLLQVPRLNLDEFLLGAFDLR